MNYFEVDGSGTYYYALIKADNEEEAIELYKQQICDELDDDFKIYHLTEE